MSRTRGLVFRELRAAGVATRAATSLTRRWIQAGDFLLTAQHLPKADWVVGNPPYLRVEDVPRKTMNLYRDAWPSMSGRADVYVGFFEAGLELLKPDGRLTYICADRWMRNSYGTALRRIIEDRFAMEVCAVMHAVDAFEDQVSAYPAINVISNAPQSQTLFVDAGGTLDAESAERLVKVWNRGPAPVAVDSAFRASWARRSPDDGKSWPDGTPEALALLADLEQRHPTLGETGATVAVGVATGSDSVYFIDDDQLVEADRLVPIVGAKETADGGIDWSGRYLVNPWNDDMTLVPLDDYPKMSTYFEENRDALERRHVARRKPSEWWRTIDRVDPKVVTRQKLLIPDLKDRIHPVLDQGQYQPLHSLYYVTSDTWDLAVLGGLLLSDVANLFVESYSVRMANGFLRVSAQYLRRIRVPDYASLDQRHRKALRAAFWNRDIPAANKASLSAYGIKGQTLVAGRLRPGASSRY